MPIAVRTEINSADFEEETSLKVVLVSSTYYPFLKGGAEVSTQNLAEALVKRGVDVLLLTAADRAGTETVNGVKVKRVEISNLYWSFQAAHQPRYKKLPWHLLDSCNVFMAKRLREIFIEERPDIVHTSKIEDFSPITWRTAKKSGHAVVHTIRDYGLMCPRATMLCSVVNPNCCSSVGRPRRLGSDRSSTRRKHVR